MDDTATRRVRLAEIDRELATLRGQYDLAMSAFKFDEAKVLQRRIDRLEDERRRMAATLPPDTATTEAPLGVIPKLARPRRLRRRG